VHLTPPPPPTTTCPHMTLRGMPQGLRPCTCLHLTPLPPHSTTTAATTTPNHQVCVAPCACPLCTPYTFTHAHFTLRLVCMAHASHTPPLCTFLHTHLHPPPLSSCTQTPHSPSAATLHHQPPMCAAHQQWANKPHPTSGLLALMSEGLTAYTPGHLGPHKSSHSSFTQTPFQQRSPTCKRFACTQR
jgi:hypothetical protein